MWLARVKAPQHGPTYIHEFEGVDPAALFRELAEALDLSAADKVTVEMWPETPDSRAPTASTATRTTEPADTPSA